MKVQKKNFFMKKNFLYDKNFKKIIQIFEIHLNENKLKIKNLKKK